MVFAKLSTVAGELEKCGNTLSVRLLTAVEIPDERERGYAQNIVTSAQVSAWGNESATESIRAAMAADFSQEQIRGWVKAYVPEANTNAWRSRLSELFRASNAAATTAADADEEPDVDAKEEEAPPSDNTATGAPVEDRDEKRVFYTEGVERYGLEKFKQYCGYGQRQAKLALDIETEQKAAGEVPETAHDPLGVRCGCEDAPCCVHYD